MRRIYIFICIYLQYLFYIVTGPQTKEVKPGSKFEVPQVEVAGLKVETAVFYVEVEMAQRWYGDGTEMVPRWYRGGTESSNSERTGAMNSLMLAGIYHNSINSI